MAQKKINQDKKWAAVIRHLTEGTAADDERRRLGVTKQAFNRWVQVYVKLHPEADKRPKTKPPPPPPSDPPAAGPVSVSPTTPGAGPVGEGGPAAGGSTGLIDTAALKAAMESDGGIPKSPTPQTSSTSQPPAPGALSLSTEKEDMEVVEGIGNQVLGVACRGMVVFLEFRSGVKLPDGAMKRLQELYVLSSTEKSMLKPASAHLARKIRELIGSNENVAYTVGGSTLGLGLFDRYRTVAEAVGAEFMVQRPDLKAAAAEEEKKRAEAQK